ncbi:MAG: hypothetical protein R3C14_43565 [Caldilineaceae bacterium]
MSVSSVIEQMPQEWQLHMFKFMEALDEKMRADLAVRREDFDALHNAVTGLTKAQEQTESRVGRLETAVTELAEAQKHTEERVGRLETAVTELAEAQKRTEARVGRLETAVTELAEAQKRTEARVGRLETAVTELAEAQKRTEARVERLETAVTELAEAQKRTEERVQQILLRQDEMSIRLDGISARQDEMSIRLDGISARQDKMDVTLGHLRGDNLERNYREKIAAYLGPVMRKVKVVALQDIVDDLERHLSIEEIDELWPLNLLVRGQVSRHPERPEIWLAIEVSHVVDRHDVTRAQQRAELLRKAGYRVLPVVAGPEMTEGAESAVDGGKVFTLRNGSRRFWEEALAQIMS